MSNSVVSVSRLKNKWQVMTKDEKNMTTPVPDESYDDEYTANIAGMILAKMLKTSFVQKQKTLK